MSKLWHIIDKAQTLKTNSIAKMRLIPVLLLTTVLSGFYTQGLIAQTQAFPVTVLTQFVPPAPINFSDYANSNSINGPLRVQLVLNDFTIGNREVRLKLFFEGQGITFESNDNVSGAPVLFLNGGVPTNLRDADLAPYFRFNNLKGISPQAYANAIPEGSYQFCFEVFDVLTGRRLSARSCATAIVFQNDPPFLVLPQRNQEIRHVNPQNIVFQWTPRHINVSNVVYKLSIVEVWDNRVDPQTAFLSAPPVFQTTTSATTFVYGPSAPLLLPNKVYAWRVNAKAKQGAETIGLFKNQGNSEIFSFRYSSPCDLPTSIAVEVKGAHQVNLSWDDFTTDIPKFNIRYRKKGSTTDWFYSRTATNWVTLWDLRANTAYEYQLNKACQVSESIWSPIAYFTTNTEEEIETLANCGIPPEIDLANKEPLPFLEKGDTFLAGDFNIKVLEVSGAEGRFTGKGYVTIPYLESIKVSVAFTNVLINTDKKLAEGIVVTAYDDSLKNIVDVDEVIDTVGDIVETTGDIFQGDANDLKEIPLNFDIDTKDIQVKDGEIIITNPNTGETVTEPLTDDTVIVDKSGDIYHVDTDGTVTKGGKKDSGGAVNAANVAGVNANGDLEALTAPGLQITFSGTGTYGFDAIPEQEKVALAAHYTSIKTLEGDPYVLVHQAVPNKGETTLTAHLELKDTTYKAEDVIFKTKQGEQLETKITNTTTIEVTLKGHYTFENEVIYAVVPSKTEENKQLTAGAFQLWHLTERAVNVKLVAVNGAQIPNEVYTDVEKIFNKGIAKVNVEAYEKILTIDTDAFGANGLDVGDSPWLKAYNDEQKDIISAFRDLGEQSKSTYYVFVFQDLKTSSNIAGFMPLQRQYGFLFSNKTDTATTEGKGDLVKTLAHEIGHGVFALQHPFTALQTTEGATDWLMDYGTGVNLSHLDWMQMHDPKLKFYVFQDEEDGEYDPWEFVADNDFLISKIPDTKETDVLTFLSTAGVAYSVSGKAKDFSFINGYLQGFTIDDERYIAGRGKSSNKFLGYFADVKDKNTKYKDDFTKDLDQENLHVFYGYVDQQSTDCNSKNRIYKAKYTGDKILSTNLGFTSSSKISLLASDKEVNDQNTTIVDLSTAQKHADVADVFNCLKTEDLKFLYKHIQYTHATEEIGFLNELFAKLNSFKYVFVGGLTTYDGFQQDKDKTHVINLKSYGDIVLFRDAVFSEFKSNPNYKDVALKIVLKNDLNNSIFPEEITDYIPFFDSISNCLSEEYGTLSADGYYVPLCLWKDADISEGYYYSDKDPAFMAGAADGGIGLVVDLYKLALGLHKLRLAYGLKLQECSPNNEFLLKEYVKAVNELKDISINITAGISIAEAPIGMDLIILQTLINNKAAFDAIKNKTDITDENVKDLADILDVLEKNTPQKFKEWEELVNKVENTLLNVSPFGNLSCEEAQKVRDNTVTALQFLEKLSDPTEIQTKKLIYEEIKKSIAEYYGATASFDNVGRYKQGKIVFEIVSEIIIAILTEGSGNLAKGTEKILAKMGSFVGKMDNLVKLALKKIDNVSGILIKRNRVFTPNGTTLLMVADENGVFKLYKVLPDDAGDVVKIEGSEFKDVDIELPNGTRLEDQDIDMVKQGDQQYVRLLEGGYNPDIKLSRLASDKRSSVNIKWKDNVDQTEIWFDDADEVIQSNASSFINEVSSSGQMADLVIDGKLYTKIDLDNGRILLGDTDGTYHAFGQINPEEFNAIKLALTDDTKLQEYLTKKAEQLEYLSGVKQKNLVLAGKEVSLSAQKVNTILGRFNPDIRNAFDELGSFKNVGLGETKGGINLLNRPDGYYDPGTWWDKYNKPWLQDAIIRGDDVYLATIPSQKSDLISESGDLLGAYAQEIKHLVDNDYKPKNVAQDKWTDIKKWFKNSSIGEAKKVVKPQNVDDLGKASVSKFSLLDELGEVTGELKRIIGKGGKEVRYFYTDFKGGNGLIKNQQYKMSPVEVPNYEIIDASQYADLNIPIGKDILYGDLQMPKVVNDNVKGLGKIMSEDAYKLLDNKAEIDGFYGLWKKDANLYADYSGESVNLTKFKEALNKGMTKEQAAFETITGKFAKQKGFNNIEFDPDFDINNLNEVRLIFFK